MGLGTYLSVVMECMQCVPPKDADTAEVHKPPLMFPCAKEGPRMSPVVRQRIDQAYEFDAVDAASGIGGFAKGRDIITGAHRAIKAMPKTSAKDPGMLLRGALAAAELEHPHVVCVHDVFEDRRTIFQVTELCSGGGLLDRIILDHSLSEACVARAIRQVLSALGYCHAKGVVHGDLNPEHCVFSDTLDSSPLKVGGFGVGTPRSSLDASCRVYRAPELDGGDANVGPAADVWSTGVMAFVLLCGEAPFDEKGARQQQAWRAFTQTASPDARCFVEQLLQPDPQDRPTALQSLQHPWVLQLCDLASSRKPQDTTLPEALERLKEFRRKANSQNEVRAVLIQQMVDFELQQLKGLFYSTKLAASGEIPCDRLRTALGEAAIAIPDELEEAFADAERNPSPRSMQEPAPEPDITGCRDQGMSEDDDPAQATIVYTEFVSAMMEYHLRLRNEAAIVAARKLVRKPQCGEPEHRRGRWSLRPFQGRRSRGE